ncbi:hypothetical protein EV180_006597, partial [Coemansia sp. RSA 518]
MQTFNHTERSVLLGRSVADSSLESLLVDGKYEDVLRSAPARLVFGTDLDSSASFSTVSPFDPEFSPSDIQPLI